MWSRGFCLPEFRSVKLTETTASGNSEGACSHCRMSGVFTPSWVCHAGGDPYCNWAKFEKQKMVAFDARLSLSTGNVSGLDRRQHDGTTMHATWRKLGKSVIKNAEMIGVSSDFWNNYEQDIKLAKDLGRPQANLPP